jgi:hypothetical protein
VLLFILLANFGWGFNLDHFELVYSTLGVVHGAGYSANCRGPKSVPRIDRDHPRSR